MIKIKNSDGTWTTISGSDTTGLVTQEELQSGLATRYSKEESDAKYVDLTSEQTITGKKKFDSDVNIGVNRYLILGNPEGKRVELDNHSLKRKDAGTGYYTYNYPDKSGTFALTSDTTPGWTRTTTSSTSTHKALYVITSKDMMIIMADDFWYTCAASTSYTINLSSYIPSTKKIPFYVKSCFTGVADGKMGSIKLDTSGTLTLYSATANPSYMNFQLVVPLIDK